MESSMDFVKRKRKESGLSSEEFGAKLGISKSHVSKWENGHVNISKLYRKLITQKFGK